MDDKPIAVLLIEDNPEEAGLLQEMLAEPSFPNSQVTLVGRLDRALPCLAETPFDLILLDLGLPDAQGVDTFARIQERAAQTPIIVLTGPEDETVGLKAVRAGAQDCLVKGQFDGNLLARAIRYAIERKRAEAVLARQEAELRAMLYGMGDAVIATDVEGRVVRMNRVSEQLTGWTEADAAGRPVTEVLCLIDEQTRRQVENPVARVLREGKIVGLANHTLLISKDGREIPVADSAAPIFDPQGNLSGVVLLFRDQTEERLIRRFMETRLSLIEYAASHTMAELLTRALDEVGAFVDSPISFYHFVEPDQRTLSLQQWSTRTLSEFCQTEGQGLHYPIDEAGVWVDCVYEKRPVIHNDYASLPHKKGLPEGHAEVVRELVVPVMRDDQVVAILGVGNKPTDYTQQDVEIVSYLADVTWEIVRQKRAEEALRKSEARYRTLFEHANDAIYLEDENDRIVDANRRACEMLGYTREELLQMSVPDLQPPEIRGQKGTVVKQELEKYRGRIFETIDLHRDGTRIPTEISTAPVPGWEAGTVMAIVRDIRERKQAQEALRESEHRYRQLFEAESDAVFMIDNETGRILEANGAAAALYGYSRQALLSMRNTDLSAEPEDTRRVTRTSPVAPDQIVNIPLRLHRKQDGTVFPVEITGRFFMWQGRPVHLAAIRDITERKLAEQARQEAYNIIRMSPAVAFLWRNQEGWPVEYVSDNVQTVLGYTPEDLLSGRVAYGQIVHPEDLERVAREVDTYGQEQDREEFVHEPYRIVTKDGRVRWLDDRTYIRRDEAGQITHYQGIILDITERRRAEEAQERLILELQEALAKVKTLSGLLPICASCKRIRDDAGYWTQVEVYIREHADVRFSHGICPECFAELYPGFQRAEE